MVNKFVYPKVAERISVKGIRVRELAEALDISANEMGRKLRGENGLWLEEAIKIRRALGEENMPLEKLFAKG